MTLEEFTPDTTIFKNENVLRDDYTPAKLIERDAELSEYQSALRPVINGASPKNVFLYGDAGLGKTLSTIMVLNRLSKDQEKYDHLEVEITYLNCKSLKSSYQVAAHLVNQFRSAEDKIKPTGYPAGMIYSMLWDHLDELDASHCLIVLDEIDSIGNDDDVLYELPRCNDNGNVEDTYVGVIGISNNFYFRDNLSARVKDSLCDEEIHFTPYDANQLRNILHQRAKEAFYDGVLDDAVIPLCAAHAAQKYGSARQAIKRLYKAGELARDEGANTVTEEHAKAADEEVDQNKVRKEISSIPTHSKILLAALLELAGKGETPAKRNDIYEQYTRLAGKAGLDRVSDRTVHDNLSQLTLKGFLEVEEKNEGPKGGSYYQYRLNVRPELANDALKQDDRIPLSETGFP